MKYRILTAEEYEKHKYILPATGRRFWLDKADIREKFCSFVNEDGMIDRFGTICSDSSIWLRPVIEYEPGEEREALFEEGQGVHLHGMMWTAVSEDILVCDRCVETLKFDDTCNDFEKSYLKYALYQYFKKIVSKEKAGLPVTQEESGQDIAVNISFPKIVFANFLFLVIAVVVGIMCVLSYSPFSLIIFVIAELIMTALACYYNIGKIKDAVKLSRRNEKKDAPAAQQTAVLTDNPALTDAAADLKLDTLGIEDAGILEKTATINGLFDAIKKTGNTMAGSKVKFFYLPETQKTLELYRSLSENDIDTPNSRECMGIIRDNLDKTIKLLRMDYDSAISGQLLETKLSGQVFGKMLDNAEQIENTKLFTEIPGSETGNEEKVL